MKTNDSVSKKPGETSDPSHPGDLSRRQLMQTAGGAAAAFTIVPRHVLGGAGFVAPSEKITLACIGFGTQAIREIGGILASPDVQVVAVCDVEKDGVNYLEWSKNQIRDGIRRLIGNPTWREGFNHVPGGRDVGKEIVETGKILGGFRSENPQLIPEARMRAFRKANNMPEPAPRQRGGGGRQGGDASARNAAWITAFNGGPANYGDFLLARPICDAVNLASISLRLGGRRLLWDSAAATITNIPDANRFLTREYRPGWELPRAKHAI